jgi:hypothetical protein
MEFMDVWYPVQVKQRDKVGRPDIDAFEAVMMREDRKLGYFVGFDSAATHSSKSIASDEKKIARSSR